MHCSGKQKQTGAKAALSAQYEALALMSATRRRDTITETDDSLIDNLCSRAPASSATRCKAAKCNSVISVNSA